MNPNPSAALPAPSPTEELLLSVQGVSKHYTLWQSPSERLRYSVLSQSHGLLRKVLPPSAPPVESLRRRRDALHRDFAALHEVSFDLRRGESMGILGRNGSGKSTLLQIIAGTLRPTRGRVEVRGRIAALLELGSGFNAEFTGRENVYLNGAILGFSKEEIDAKFDAIASFADIGLFLDQPVKTYSSGMMVRLAFSVQMAVEPALFIIDEALAVGDIYFQNKCNKLLSARLDEGLTLLLVSHNPTAVRTLCKHALVLDHGHTMFLGPGDEAVNVYNEIGSRQNAAANGGGASCKTKGVGTGELSPAAVEPVFNVPQGLGKVQDEIGDRAVELTGCAMYNMDGHAAGDFLGGESIRVAFTFRSQFGVGDLLVGFAIRNVYNIVVAAGTTANQRLTLPPVEPGRLHTMFLTIAGRLGAGEYLLDVGLGGQPDTAGSPTVHHHRVGGIRAFTIGWGGRAVAFQGLVDLEAAFELPPLPIATSRDNGERLVDSGLAAY